MRTAVVYADSSASAGQARRFGYPQGTPAAQYTQLLSGLCCYDLAQAMRAPATLIPLQAQLRACVFAVVDGQESSGYGTGLQWVEAASML